MTNTGYHQVTIIPLPRCAQYSWLVHNNNKLQPPKTKEAYTHTTVTLYFIEYVQQYLDLGVNRVCRVIYLMFNTFYLN